MSQRKEKEKKNINNKKQKNSLKLFDCFKNCLKSNKKPKDESISEAELILKTQRFIKIQHKHNLQNKQHNLQQKTFKFKQIRISPTKQKTHINPIKIIPKKSQKKKQHSQFI